MLRQQCPNQVAKGAMGPTILHHRLMFGVTNRHRACPCAPIFCFNEPRRQARLSRGFASVRSLQKSLARSLVYLDAGVAVSAWRRKAIPSGQAERVVSFPPAGAFDFNARP